MALLMPTAPMAAGLSRPTIMVSTMDMAIHPSSESTTGMANRNKAANSVRKREGVGDCVTGTRDGMVLFTLTDPGILGSWRRWIGRGSLLGYFKMVKSMRRAMFASFTGRDGRV